MGVVGYFFVSSVITNEYHILCRISPYPSKDISLFFIIDKIAIAFNCEKSCASSKIILFIKLPFFNLNVNLLIFTR